MKILIIASEVGKTAQGIVYETLIKELANHTEITLIVGSLRKGLVLNVPVIYIPSLEHSNIRIQKAFFSLIGRNILNDIWLWGERNAISSSFVLNYDVVLSFTSNHNYKSMLLSHYLSNVGKKPWMLYSVDAIPAPIGWNKDTSFFRNTRKFINKYIKQCDVFFSSNQQMLDYQLSSIDFKGRSAVLFTPIRDIEIIEDFVKLESPTFLYAGGIYGPRKVDALLEGFRLFLQNYPTARLVFVGTETTSFVRFQDLISSGNIIINEYNPDLTHYYNSSTALIDINACFDNDVFLSSKIVNYLRIRRPIISITGLNSPSRNIFSCDPSVIHCRHDAIEICNALHKSYECADWDWSKREIYISQFDVKNVVRTLLRVIREIL